MKPAFSIVELLINAKSRDVFMRYFVFAFVLFISACSTVSPEGNVSQTARLGELTSEKQTEFDFSVGQRVSVGPPFVTVKTDLLVQSQYYSALGQQCFRCSISGGSARQIVVCGDDGGYHRAPDIWPSTLQDL